MVPRKSHTCLDTSLHYEVSDFASNLKLFLLLKKETISIKISSFAVFHGERLTILNNSPIIGIYGNIMKISSKSK